MARRAGFLFLCALPFAAGALAAARALNAPGVRFSVGGACFVAACAAAWVVGLRAVARPPDENRALALAGALLVTPSALIALLWVGIGPPWEATVSENRLRYLVLLVGSACVAGGFIVVREALGRAGERFYSTIAFGAGLLAGAASLVWSAFVLGVYVALSQPGQTRASFEALSAPLDTLLFGACSLNYIATAGVAASFGKSGWLGRRAALAFIGVSLLALALIVLRGVTFPDPTSMSTPWYTRPGFIAGIPAAPWIMPSLLGAVALRCAGRR